MGTGNFISLERTTVPIEVGEDGFGHLESPLLRFDQRGLKGVDIASTPQALVSHDGDLTKRTAEGFVVELHPNFLEDVRISRVETSLCLYFASLLAAPAVESLSVVDQEDSFGEVLTFVLSTVPDCSVHLSYLLCLISWGSRSMGTINPGAGAVCWFRRTRTFLLSELKIG